MGQPYPQPYGYAAVPQAPQRNQLLFVASILCIIGGALGLILSIVAFAGIGLAASLGASVGLLVIMALFALVAAGFELYAGITGQKNAANPAKGAHLFNLGIILCGISLISLILNIVSAAQSGGSPFSGILGFVIPVLFLVGASQLKKQAV